MGCVVGKLSLCMGCAPQVAARSRADEERMHQRMMRGIKASVHLKDIAAAQVRWMRGGE